ncbi:hypothetical protein [Clostridium perfringens]|uniref:hypothetical protein n=1 Tax=Clostridium perfringens TaxID=1502 RepID=UPI0024BD008E|nr:hypothetical protein [Clostridium perfringens]MDM0618076.1 hypothetical protein [Clostridium perfringens]
MESKFLKYTSNELINKVIEKENINVIKDEDINRVVEKYELNKEQFKKLLNFPNILSYEMYQIISKILNKSIKELTEIKTIELKVDYRRTNIESESGEVKNLLVFANSIFEEIISVKRLKI